MPATRDEIEAQFLREMPRYRWTADDAVAAALAGGVNFKGKNVIVTGATSGIGVETVLALAKTGCHLTVTARNPKKAADFEAQYRAAAQAAGGSVVFAPLDLESYASVKAFATRWGAAKPIDVLLHNAGGLGMHRLTGDGEEEQMQTNFLSLVLLTELLRSNLAPKARIVIVSSAAHCFIPAGADFLGIFHYYLHGVKTDAEKFDRMACYATSKSLGIMYANALTAEFVAEGSGVRAVTVHPGVIPTPLADTLPEAFKKSVLWHDEHGNINPYFKTTPQGAATSVWAALSPELDGVGGVYLENSAITPTDRFLTEHVNWAAPDPKLVGGTAPHVWKEADCRTITSETRTYLASKGLL